MKPKMKLQKAITLVLTPVFLLAMGCESALTVDENQHPSGIDESKKTVGVPLHAVNVSTSMAKTNASFPVYHQGFNHDTDPWADQSNPGPTGWCGTIELEDKQSGTVKPSKGNGYATLERGPCNDFWSFLPFGAPASTLDFDLFSTTWPESGFIQKLDIYLDPEDYADGVVFRYFNSLNALNSTSIPYDFLYFRISANKTNGELDVAGHTIEEEGWYTFRYVFNDDGSGNLTADFQLVKSGQVIHSKSMDDARYLDPVPPFSVAPTSSFEVAELGSGYIWFEYLADGLKLPIDEYHLHPGNFTP